MLPAVGLIAKFFSERIVDSSCLRAVINGLIALAVSPHFSAHVVDVLTIIFKEVHVQVSAPAQCTHAVCLA